MRSDIWMWRSFPVRVDVILPKFVLCRLPFGLLNCGVFAKLKASARNEIRYFSLTLYPLDSDRSSVRVGGAYMLFPPKLPYVPGAARVTVSVANHLSGFRPMAGLSCGFLPGIRSRRQLD